MVEYSTGFPYDYGNTYGFRYKLHMKARTICFLKTNAHSPARSPLQHSYEEEPLQMTCNMFMFPEAQQNGLWNLHVQVLLIRKLPLGQRRSFYAGSETSKPTGLRWLREHMRGAEGDHLQAFEDSSGPSTIATLPKGEKDHFWSIEEILSLSKTSRKM